MTATVTVASSNEATRKKCQGRSPEASASAGGDGAGAGGGRRVARFSRRAGSVKVAELIVQSAFECGVNGCVPVPGCGLRRGTAPRPPYGGDTRDEQAGRPKLVGHH